MTSIWLIRCSKRWKPAMRLVSVDLEPAGGWGSAKLASLLSLPSVYSVCSRRTIVSDVIAGADCSIASWGSMATPWFLHIWVMSEGNQRPPFFVEHRQQSDCESFCQYWSAGPPKYNVAKWFAPYELRDSEYWAEVKIWQRGTRVLLLI